MVVPQSSSRGSLKTIDATAPVFDLLYADIQSASQSGSYLNKTEFVKAISPLASLQ